MRLWAGEQSGVAIVIERRDEDRRGCDRREEGPHYAPDEERRVVRNVAGRRLSERRATLVPVACPGELPRRARIVVDRLVFVERLEAGLESVEDLDTARLVTRIQAGDEAGFGELYTRYFDRVYAYMRIALDDSHEAEDVAQQVFLQVLEALPRYELRSSPFRAWLFRIVRNTAIKHLAKHRRIEPEDPSELDRRRLRRDDGAEDMSALSWVGDEELLLLIERLPTAQRQVMMLRYMMDLTCPEIAAILGRSPDAVRQLQHRALTFLRERLVAVGREPKQARVPMSMRRRPALSRVIPARRLALFAG